MHRRWCTLGRLFLPPWLVGGDAEDVRRRAGRVKPDVVRFATNVRRPGEFIGYGEPQAAVYAESGPIQPDSSLTRHVRVQVDYDENRIATPRAGNRRTHTLRKAQGLLAVREIEAQVTQLLQCGV